MIFIMLSAYFNFFRTPSPSDTWCFDDQRNRRSYKGQDIGDQSQGKGQRLQPCPIDGPNRTISTSAAGLSASINSRIELNTSTRPSRRRILRAPQTRPRRFHKPRQRRGKLYGNHFFWWLRLTCPPPAWHRRGRLTPLGLFRQHITHIVGLAAKFGGHFSASASINGLRSCALFPIIDIA